MKDLRRCEVTGWVEVGRNINFSNLVWLFELYDLDGLHLLGDIWCHLCYNQLPNLVVLCLVWRLIG